MKFHISLPTSGLNLSFGHLLMDLRSEYLKKIIQENVGGTVNIFWGRGKHFWGSNIFGVNIFFRSKIFGTKMLQVQTFGGQILGVLNGMEWSACAMGKRGPTLA